MRILAINGSHRGDKGHTRYLVDQIFAGAQEAGAECEVVTLSKIKMKRCIACAKCQKEKSLMRCVFHAKDDVASVFEKISAADLVIYGTPIYVFNMSSLLKTFLDRFYCAGVSGDLEVTESGLLFHKVRRDVCSKPFVALVCCDNVEDETPRTVISYFGTFSKFLDAPQVGTLVRNGGKILGHGRDHEALAEVPRAPHVYAAFRKAGRELASQGRISRLTQWQASREVVPLPLFSLIKKLKSRKLREVMVQHAHEQH